MQQSHDDLYECIKDLKSKPEFSQEIQARYTQYEELFDKDTIALLLIDELGKNTQGITKIEDIRPDTDCTVVGTVSNIYDPRTFTRKNGSEGKVTNIDISDETGTCRLVLWDKDVQQIQNNEIQIGSKVKIINGYTKNGYSGIEVNLGRWGLLETESPDRTNFHEDNDTTITGELIDKEPTKAFFKDSGEFGFVTKIKIKQKDCEKHLTVWDTKVKEIQKYKIGDKIILKNITIKENGTHQELHVNGQCIIEQSK
jgi:replication factor A1